MMKIMTTMMAAVAVDEKGGLVEDNNDERYYYEENYYEEGNNDNDHDHDDEKEQEMVGLLPCNNRTSTNTNTLMLPSGMSINPTTQKSLSSKAKLKYNNSNKNNSNNERNGNNNREERNFSSSIDRSKTNNNNNNKKEFILLLLLFLRRRKKEGCVVFVVMMIALLLLVLISSRLLQKEEVNNNNNNNNNNMNDDYIDNNLKTFNENSNINSNNNNNNNNFIFQCPRTNLIDSQTKEDDIDVGVYIHQGQEKLQNLNTVNEVWDYMQSIQVDDWFSSYKENKCMLEHFKENEIIPYLLGNSEKITKHSTTLLHSAAATVVAADHDDNDDDSSDDEVIRIYESACGIGRNLVITLDILKDMIISNNKSNKNPNHNIKKNDLPTIEIYGNDYSSDSARAARIYFGGGGGGGGGEDSSSSSQQQSHLPPPFNDDDAEDLLSIKLGSICGGIDSTNLTSFVPSNTMDIVYTGYLPPLVDPLDLSTKVPWKSIQDQYIQLCNNVKHSPTAMEDVTTMYEIQEDWYAKFVGEMIRIAKPDSPIIIESIPPRKCDYVHELGGVNPEFWTMRAPSNERYLSDYNWNMIDIESIRIIGLDDCHDDNNNTSSSPSLHTLWTQHHFEHRYHVSMKKKKKEKKI